MSVGAIGAGPRGILLEQKAAMGGWHNKTPEDAGVCGVPKETGNSQCAALSLALISLASWNTRQPGGTTSFHPSLLCAKDYLYVWTRRFVHLSH